MLAFEDPELTIYEKQMIMFSNIYATLPKENVGEAMKCANWFLNCGKESQQGELSTRLYSFSKDAELIFAAFRQTHGIDLETAQMHWWKFIALFMDLGSDTAFCNLIGLRKRVKSGKATKEEKEAAREMGDMFDVPEADDRTIEEKEREAEFIRMVGAK